MRRCQQDKTEKAISITYTPASISSLAPFVRPLRDNINIHMLVRLSPHRACQFRGELVKKLTNSTDGRFSVFGISDRSMPVWNIQLSF